ncbi:MAG: UDP-N-acetylmuramyl-tripeptide synthetase [Candidatus Kerfeldbacteria bacterium]|nr:UDP-N-acetylmuramyl-tripeptide synthetase [Candidatus Kerfeldbacteria bacterium]
MKRLLKRFIPEALLLQYHRWLAQYGAWRYQYPARQLIVIGVTGTKGKSTTSNLIWHLLTAAGYTVGLATTVNYRIGTTAWLNDTKMTMRGRTQLQQLLRKMVQAGCQYAVIETSSEGIKQSRHIGIAYDVMVFTNLSPEHLDAHGGFENYKAIKLRWFDYVSRQPTKLLHGQPVHKVAVMNGDDPAAPYFYQAARVETKVVWSQHPEQCTVPVNLTVQSATETNQGVTCTIGQQQFSSPLLGIWNIENIVSAVAVAASQAVPYSVLAEALPTFFGVPGRMEIIDEGQPFTVVVDYAYEPKSLGLLYGFWRKQVGSQHKLITLISSTGGGRDVWRRPVNGQVAAELCDYVIVTNEDPYDENPITIMTAVLAGAKAAGKVDHTNVWLQPDRQAAIQQACQLAQPGDVVLLTAKGAEQKMCLANGKKIAWDDRAVARQVLQALLTLAVHSTV